MAQRISGLWKIALLLIVLMGGAMGVWATQSAPDPYESVAADNPVTVYASPT